MALRADSAAPESADTGNALRIATQGRVEISRCQTTQRVYRQGDVAALVAPARPSQRATFRVRGGSMHGRQNGKIGLQPQCRLQFIGIMRGNAKAI